MVGVWECDFVSGGVVIGLFDGGWCFEWRDVVFGMY